ncbi:FmdB family zinc ribbon protein [Actinokineospora guangxiensis]|uniref:FmdB family zinc ribbon protein n=1 Tax=Actinokineospora guangxiensis TaxID=1490288 RepID=A0ABW0EI80_9PSEU
MPTYQYACTACEHRFEAVQKFTDASLTECPECTGKLRKLYGSVGVVFKGSGFYRNDSRSKSSSAVSSSDAGKSSGESKSSDAGKSSDSGASSDSSSGSGSSPKPAESKPAAAKSTSTTTAKAS